MSIDYVLVLRYPGNRADLVDQVERIVFLSRCDGTSVEDGPDMTEASLYFASAEDRTEAARIAGEIDGIQSAEEDRSRIDWLERYEQSLEALPIGRRLIVAPDSALVHESGRIPIVIPQERAFGTGGHASTAMCLELLEEIGLEGRDGLDIGAGSGILAIGMQKLGARRVVAFDNDVETFGVLSDNLGRNGIPEGAVVQFFGTIDALGSAKFGAITMNIIAEAIVPMLGRVRELLAEGGAAIVSGVIRERVDDVVGAAAAAGLGVDADRWRDEWWAGLLRRR